MIQKLNINIVGGIIKLINFTRYFPCGIGNSRSKRWQSHENFDYSVHEPKYKLFKGGRWRSRERGDLDEPIVKFSRRMKGRGHVVRRPLRIGHYRVTPCGSLWAWSYIDSTSHYAILSYGTMMI